MMSVIKPNEQDDFDAGDDDPLVENTEWIDQRMKNLSSEENAQLKRAEEVKATATDVKSTATQPADVKSKPPPELLPALKHECSNLLCKTVPLPEKLSLCGRCRQVQYCSKECQTQDWKKTHKQDCMKLVEKAMTQDVAIPTSSNPVVTVSPSSSTPVVDDKAIRRKQLVDKGRARMASKKKRDTDKQKMTPSGQAVPDISGMMSSMTDVLRNMSNSPANEESKRATLTKQIESMTSTIGKLMPGQQKKLASFAQKMSGKTELPAHEPTKGKGKKRHTVLALPPDDD